MPWEVLSEEMPYCSADLFTFNAHIWMRNASHGWAWPRVVPCVGCESDAQAMEAERQKHQSLFVCGRVDLADFFEQDPIELAAIVHGWFKACNEEQEVRKSVAWWTNSDSGLSNYPLARRPVVGYLNRSMMPSNRLCNTSVITWLLWCLKVGVIHL